MFGYCFFAQDGCPAHPCPLYVPLQGPTRSLYLSCHLLPFHQPSPEVLCSPWLPETLINFIYVYSLLGVWVAPLISGDLFGTLRQSGDVSYPFYPFQCPDSSQANSKTTLGPPRSRGQDSKYRFNHTVCNKNKQTSKPGVTFDGVPNEQRKSGCPSTDGTNQPTPTPRPVTGRRPSRGDVRSAPRPSLARMTSWIQTLKPMTRSGEHRRSNRVTKDEKGRDGTRLDTSRRRVEEKHRVYTFVPGCGGEVLF